MPQGSRAEKEHKRHAVAVAKLVDQGTRATARRIGCSERHVRRLAAEPETRFLITEALRPHHAALTQLAARAITVIEEAMSAMKTDEADHRTRLRAVERYCELAELCTGQAAGTWERRQPADDLGGVHGDLQCTTGKDTRRGRRGG